MLKVPIQFQLEFDWNCWAIRIDPDERVYVDSAQAGKLEPY